MDGFLYDSSSQDNHGIAHVQGMDRFANNFNENDYSYSDQTALLHHTLHHLSLTNKMRVVMVMACLIVVPSVIVFVVCLLKDKRERHKRDAIAQRERKTLESKMER